VRVTAVSPPKQEIAYHICAHNTSPAAAHHVLVRNPLPANARFVRATPEPSSRETELQWLLGTLPPGACREIVLVLAPPDANAIKNCARVQFEPGQCVTTRIVRPVPVPGAAVPEFKEPPPLPPPPEKQPPPEKKPPEKQPPADAAKLKLTMTGPKRQYVNLPVKYRITVSNPGTAAATKVQIANPIPPAITPPT